MDEVEHYLSGGVFDDLYLMSNGLYVEKYTNSDELKTAIYNIVSRIKKDHEGIVDSIYFRPSDIVEDLITNDEKCIKWCRIEKYYCIVISRDFYRPYIWSKDCDCKRVDWEKIGSAENGLIPSYVKMENIQHQNHLTLLMKIR